MYTLELENFQSISQQTFELKGFVAITGPSNLGKSAIRRAIGSVLYNDWQPNFQRNYKHKKAGSTKITFAKDGEYKIHQVKPDNSITLYREGQEKLHFGKVGRTVPEEVKALGYNILTVNDSFLNLNITRQTDQLFMVSYMTATNTAILNKLFNLTKLEQASALATKDSKEEVKNRNRSDGEYQEAERQIHETNAKLEQVEATRDKLKLLITNIELIDKYLNNEASLAEAKEALDKATKDAENYKSILARLESLSLVTAYQQATVDLTESVARLSDVEGKHSKMAEAKSILEKLVMFQVYNDNVKALRVFKADHDAVLSDLAEQDKVRIHIEEVLAQHKALTEQVETIDSFEGAKQSISTGAERLTAVTAESTRLHNLDNIRPILNLQMNRAKVAKADALLADNGSKREQLVSLLPVFDKVALLASWFDLELALQDVDDLVADVDHRRKLAQEELESFPRCETCNQVLMDHDETEHAEV